MNVHVPLSGDVEVVRLERLRFGHEHPLGDIDARRIGRNDPRPELRASVAADGILQSLLVTSYDGDDFLYVIAGNGRLDAARAAQLEDAPCIVKHNLTVDEAIALGLAEELPKLAWHKVDRFDAFDAMRREEKTSAEIAARYGVAEIEVKRALRLAAIPQQIRDAWRAGEIDEAAARVFTLARDEKTALKTFDRLKKLDQLEARHIRASLVPDQGDAVAHVEFVGLDAYRAAGGEAIVDLFDGPPVLSDAALAYELACTKLAKMAEDLIFDGKWGWALPADHLPADWRSWETIKPASPKPTREEKARFREITKQLDDAGITPDIEDALGEEHEAMNDRIFARSYTDEEKAALGCILWLDTEGRARIEHGIRKPEAAPKKKSARGDAENAEKEEESGAARKKKSGAKRQLSSSSSSAGEASPREPSSEPAELSNAHKIQLGITLTEATAMALREQPELAVLVLMAGFASEDGFSNGPIRVRVNGLACGELDWSETHIAQNLARWKDLPREQLDAVLAQVAAAAIGFNYFKGDHALCDPDISAICNLLDPARMATALGKRFDAEAYFAKAPKAFALAAIADICGADEARRHATKPKSEIVKVAIGNMPGTGWLPVELRVGHYVGPGSALRATPGKPDAEKKRAAKVRDQAKAAAKREVRKKNARAK